MFISIENDAQTSKSLSLRCPLSMALLVPFVLSARASLRCESAANGKQSDDVFK